MTDHANAELIAEARQLIRHSSVSAPEHANMLGRLADALEAVEQDATARFPATPTERGSHERLHAN